jgi:tetratricopeptide (TPR) repeat protein
MRRRSAAALGLVAAIVGLAGTTSAQAPSSQLLEQAIASYGRGLDTAERALRLEEFRRAERLFARVAAEGAGNPDLYANLGNAALQADHLGTAVLAYRRALALDPAHPRAGQNLAHARTLLPAWVPKPQAAGLLDSFFFWHRTLSRSDRAFWAAVAFAVAGLLAAASIRAGQPVLRNAAMLPALVWLALIASVVMDDTARSADAAVIVADETVARAADSALAPSALPAPLPGGVEVRIVERRPPWLRVRLGNGRDAWVAESAVALVEVH